MKKHPSLPPKTDQKTLSKLEREFHLQYGTTLGAWARVEQTLSRLFCALCGFDNEDTLGVELFFSGRSFQTRADLLWAALRVAEMPPELDSNIRTVLKRARDYSNARNKIAHGYPAHVIFADVEWQGWRIKEGEASKQPGGIGIEELRNAQANFLDLDLMIEAAITFTRWVEIGVQIPEERLSLPQGLPPDAFLPSRYQNEEAPPQPGIP